MTTTSREKKRIAEFVKPFRVEPGSKVVLKKDFDPGATPGAQSKQWAQDLLVRGVEVLSEYQARLAAQDTYGVLVVLQAMDAAGKDGTIRHVMSGVNPQGVSVKSFKVPSNEELDHDYLWRYAQRLPARGEIGIFNRSHYEEVVVVRVHEDLLTRQKLPKEARGPDVWKRRFREINDWERYLTDNGFRLVKLFLNLSKEEQRRRFLRRIDDPKRNWKFSSADARERSYWNDYQKAFSEMLSQTSTDWAPWHVIPADHKWFARLAAAAVIADELIRIDPRFPKLDKNARRGLEEARAELDGRPPAAGGHGSKPDGDPALEHVLHASASASSPHSADRT
jgi:PPK2 family polyphosphate:nucleotide phosphotransferase